MVDWNGDPRPAYCALTKQPIATCHGLDVSRDCGGPGKGNCGGTASSSTAVCCAKCSNEDDAYYAAQVGSATCAQAAASFCGDVDYSRGSVESMYLGSCVVAPY